MQCRNCQGRGYTYALICRLPPHRGGIDALSCEDCNGTGEISEQEAQDAAQRQVEGEKIRVERKKCGMTLRAYAKHLGIGVATLSAMERGKRPV
jgi:DNA-binding transcriptional regulator YiaG